MYKQRHLRKIAWFWKYQCTNALDAHILILGLSLIIGTIMAGLRYVSMQVVCLSHMEI